MAICTHCKVNKAQMFSSLCARCLNDPAFTSASPTSLFVFGVDVQSQYKSPSLVFLKYDPTTGKAIARSARHVSPRQDDLPAGQRIGAALTGQQSLPNGRSLFVVDLPAGDWVLWCISAYYNNGLGTSYSSVSYLAKGTITLHAAPGQATYIGEYEINGDVGGDLALVELPRRFDKTRGDLASFQIQVELQNTEIESRTFTCERKTILLSETPCAGETVVVVPAQTT